MAGELGARVFLIGRAQNRFGINVLTRHGLTTTTVSCHYSMVNNYIFVKVPVLVYRHAFRNAIIIQKPIGKQKHAPIPVTCHIPPHSRFRKAFT
jgi:hypothetical protein